MLAFRNKILIGSFGLYTVASRFAARPSAFAMSSQHSGSDEKEVHVEQFMKINYRPAGKVLKLKDSTEFYAVGFPRSKRGVIIIPDLGGYNAGNSRNIADYLAANDTYVAIPSILGAPKGADEHVPSILEAQSLGEYSKAQILEGNLKPKIRSLVKQMKEEGVEKIALVGFSWGGWVATNVLASNDLAQSFSCGVLAHPSINLEERMYGGSLVELFSHVKRPILVLPARGDPHEYDHFVQMLKYRCPSSDVIDYRGYEHNFLLRGRVEDSDIRHADIKALHEITSYLNYHFDYEGGELNRHTEKIMGNVGNNGHSRSSSPGQGQDQRTWTEYLQDSYNYMREGVAQSVSGTWEQAKQGTQQLGDRLREDAERARDAFNRTTYQTREEYEKAKHAAEEEAHSLRDSAAQSIRRLRENADKVVNNVQRSAYRTEEEYEQAKKHANEQAHRMRQEAEQAEHEAEERWNRSKQEVKETWEQFKQRAQQTRDEAGDYMQHTGEQTQETWDKTKQGRKEILGKTKEGAQETRNEAEEYAQQTSEKAQNMWNYTKGGTKDNWDKTKQGAEQTRNKASQYTQKAGEQTQAAGNKTKEEAQKAGEYVQQTGEKAKETADKTRQRAGETAEQFKVRTQETGQYVGETVKTAGEKLKEGVQSVGESIKRTFNPGDTKDHDDDRSRGGGSGGRGR